jgi:ectoine hydroxylase-related dioxygenase (phytanoyl-CoA dioxygenase family)
MSATTATQRTFFAERGYLPFGHVYSAPEVERLRGALTEVLAASGPGTAAEDGMSHGVAVYRIASAPGRTSLSMDRLFRVHEVFQEHAFNPAIARAAAELLDADCMRLMMDQVIIKEPHTSGEINWHQDFAYWTVQPATQVSCWLALDLTTRDAGALQFVPGSHLLGEFALVPVGATGKSRADPRPVIPAEPAAAGYEVVSVELEPGECVFHHALTWHASPPNATERLRRGLITRFMARGTRFAPGRHALRVITSGEAPAPGDLLESDEFPVVWPQG